MLSLVMLVVACGDVVPDGPLHAARMTDRSQNEKLQLLLKAKGIYFRLEKDGYVLYGARDASVVREVMHEITCKNRDTGITFGEDTEKRRLFLGDLQKAGVPYKTKVVNGHEWIYWDLSDDAKVNKVIRRHELFGPNSQDPCDAKQARSYPH